MNKSIAIMQPYFFPYIGYFQLINSVDKFIIYDDVNYIKQGWINRNLVLLNNKAHLITLPLSESSSFRLICETKINKKYYQIWVKKFIKLLDQSYKNAPYFEDTMILLKSILDIEYNYISQLNLKSIKTICNYLEINTIIKSSSNNYNNIDLKSFERVIDICKKENCSVYVNSIGGEKLYSKNIFSSFNIELKFIETKDIFYNQFQSDYINNLSIIDVLMFNDVKTIKQLLLKYELN